MYVKKRGKKRLQSALPSSSPLSPSPAPLSGPPLLHESSSAPPSRVGAYQLLETIGKGGYGLVYRGVNVTSGLTVAIKRITLTSIADDELEIVFSEVSLLRALAHDNIVKYLDSVRSTAALYLILEYVENGALSSLQQRFGGCFPESLVCHYIVQVLMGLAYLHQQGVIHRDIKGANLLTTKEGQVKLADFGVATKLTESRLKSESVVGTPYWMAPEIIEMTGASSACDIWSVGCTTIELLTGKPPYFDLQQMPALFRIVQDEHPPLPDAISPALTDFLLQCFQKDPNRRIDANGLLKHPWLRSAISLEQTRARAVSQGLPFLVPPITAGIGAAKQEKSISFSPYLPAPSSSPAAPLTQQNHFRERKPQDQEAEEEEDWDAELNEDTKAQPLKLKSFTQNAVKAECDVDSFADWSEGEGDNSTSFPPATVLTAVTRKMQDLSAFVEADDEYEAVADDTDWANLDDEDLQPKRLQMEGEWQGNEAIDAAFDEFDEGSERVIDEAAALHKPLGRLVSALDVNETEDVLIEQLDKLMDMYKKSPSIVMMYLSAHAVIPLMELLTSDVHAVIHSTLRLINTIIALHPQFQQSLALVGIIPAMIRLAVTSTHIHLIRLEAAHFIRQLCYHSDATRKLFIACDGVPVLVHLLQQEHYFDHPILVLNTIDCIKHVFDISSQPKNDFCRLFCKFNLLPSLMNNFLLIIREAESYRLHTLNGMQTTGAREALEAGRAHSIEYVSKISSILLLFSQGDSIVKKSMSHSNVIAPLLTALSLFNSDQNKQNKLLLLKSLTYLSMESSVLDDLEQCQIISLLMPYLHPEQPLEIQNQTLLTMFYLTQLKSSRQETAAKENILIHLIRFIRNNSPLKQFAFPIFFLVLRTYFGRMQARKYNGIDLLMECCIPDVYWCTGSLDVLAAWLSDEPAKIGFLLLNNKTHFERLLDLFVHIKGNELQYEKLLPLFRKLLSGNLKLNRAFGYHRRFLQALKAHLLRFTHNNNIRVNLLNLLGLIIVSSDPSHLKDLNSDEELQQILHDLAADQISVLVAGLAKKTIDRLQQVP